MSDKYIPTNLPPDTLEAAQKRAENMRAAFHRCNEDSTKTILALRAEIERLKWEKWVSVEDEKPRDYEVVMYFDSEDRKISVGYFVCSQTKMPDYVTHWQPLPPSPNIFKSSK